MLKGGKKIMDIWKALTIVLGVACIYFIFVQPIVANIDSNYQKDIYEASNIKIEDADFYSMLDIAKNNSWDGFIITDLGTKRSIHIDLKE